MEINRKSKHVYYLKSYLYTDKEIHYCKHWKVGVPYRQMTNILNVIQNTSNS